MALSYSKIQRLRNVLKEHFTPKLVFQAEFRCNVLFAKCDVQMVNIWINAIIVMWLFSLI